MAISTMLSMLLRWWRRRGLFSLGFSFANITMCLSYIVGTMAYSFLANAGRPIQDSAGNVRPSGVDLSNPGMIYEWIFDLLYITCEHHFALSRIWPYVSWL